MTLSNFTITHEPPGKIEAPPTQREWHPQTGRWETLYPFTPLRFLRNVFREEGVDVVIFTFRQMPWDGPIFERTAADALQTLIKHFPSFRPFLTVEPYDPRNSPTRYDAPHRARPSPKDQKRGANSPRRTAGLHPLSTERRRGTQKNPD
jgi:hypothetical protein